MTDGRFSDKTEVTVTIFTESQSEKRSNLVDIAM